MDAFETLRLRGADHLLRFPKANIHVRGPEGQSLIQEAISRRDTSSAIKLARAGVNVDNQDNAGLTAVHYAVIFSNLDMIKELVALGASTLLIDKHGNSPLWRACIEDRSPYPMVRFLLANGADPRQKNRAGRSPADLATQFRNEELIQLLLGNK